MTTIGRVAPVSGKSAGEAGWCTPRVGGCLGIALSGGSGRALAQLGVLKVLDREGIPVSYLAGTSMGAIIGALYATSSSAMQAEERLLAYLARARIGLSLEGFETVRITNRHLSIGFLDLVDALGRAARARGSLIGANAMRAALRELLGDATLGETRIGFATTAFDIVSGCAVQFVGGSLVEAVYASSAIAGLFEPLSSEGQVLVDGGLAEPVPVNTCRRLGAAHVVAIDVSGPRIQGGFNRSLQHLT